MRVLFLSSGLHVGGFSKSLVYMIECLQSRGVQVDLLLLRRTDDEWLLESLGSLKIVKNSLTDELARTERSKLSKALAIIRTGRILNRLWVSVLRYTAYRGSEVPIRLQLRSNQLDDERLVSGLRSRVNFIETYDCVVSWEESLCNYVLAAKIAAKRKIGYIHSDYIEAGFYAPPDRRLLDRLDAIAFVSEANRESFCRAIPELASKSVTIPNVLSVARIRRLARVEPAVEMECSVVSILTVCRLQNVSKALDRAARVCARMKYEGLHFKWFFVGSGPDQEMFEALIKKLGI